ncbi:hypothetical protein [Azotobacter vinelandii]|uniref:hypothetical protein n=1 Tax=Azotobacter vinelandii TaxID=354 RepID=UPI002666F85D|nr:hypothetical protein [Azotobacter vinelandii]WKN22171.1 hypothetical protein AVAEIV_000121 [Azotobacter vinelandii]
MKTDEPHVPEKPLAVQQRPSVSPAQSESEFRKIFNAFCAPLLISLKPQGLMQINEAIDLHQGASAPDFQTDP